MLPTLRESAGPNPLRVARDNRAEYRQHRLLDELGRRPGRPRPAANPEAVKDSIADRRGALLGATKAKLRDPKAIAALEAMVDAEAFSSLRDGLQRGLLGAIRSVPLAKAAQRFVLPLAEADRRTQTDMLAAFDDAAKRGPIMEVLLRLATSPLFSRFDGTQKRHAIRIVTGPKVQTFSWSGHQTILDQWWLRHQRNMQPALVEDVEVAKKAWDAFVHDPRVPVQFLKSEAFPGVVLLIIGAADDPHALAYARIFFMDEDKRLRVGLKSPVEPVRGGWSPKVDPKGVEYEFRRADLSLDEALAFVRWVEDNHTVSGSGGLHQPSQTQRAVYDGLIQFDIRAPRMVDLFCAHRGPLTWTEGVMVRGRAVAPARRKAA